MHAIRATSGSEAAHSGCYIAPAVERVLVLNASYEPLNVCSLRRAHVLVWKGKAEVLESHGQPLRSSSSTFTRPHVIRLVTYVRVPRGVTKRISRRVLFARDGWKCVYCGTESNRLTLDHVVPRSRGAPPCGRTSSRPAHRATTARGTGSSRRRA